jgi:hypothetical protein
LSVDSPADPNTQAAKQAVAEAHGVEDEEQVCINVVERVEDLQESCRSGLQVVVMQPVDVGAAEVP